MDRKHTSKGRAPRLGRNIYRVIEGTRIQQQHEKWRDRRDRFQVGRTPFSIRQSDSLLH